MNIVNSSEGQAAGAEMLAFDPAVHVPEDIIAPADAPGTLPDMTAAPCLAAALDEAAAKIERV